eukprot:Awhi_evm1s3654
MQTMEDAKQQFETVCVEIDARLRQFSQTKEIEEKTKVRPAFLFLGAAAVLLFLCYFIFEESFLINIIGFSYPAYASIKAIESKGQDDDTQWLTYWVVFAFLSVIECFSDQILYVFSFYFGFKLCLLIWCFLPQTRGASVIYQKAIKPLMQSQQKSFTDKVSDKVNDSVTEAVAETKESLNKLE